jgi:uncharacterized membrane protein
MVSNVESFVVKNNEQENLLQFIRGIVRSAGVVVVFLRTISLAADC